MTQRILFLCTGNACRSQMAHGWANSLMLPEVEFYSAGIEAHGINHHAVKVMLEAGIDISHHQSHRLSEFDDIEFDIIFAVCDKASQRWPTNVSKVEMICQRFDDPPALAKHYQEFRQQLDCYRSVRDQIQQWIFKLPQQLQQLNSKKLSNS